MGDWEDTATPRRARHVVCALLFLALTVAAPLGQAAGSTAPQPDPPVLELRKTAGTVTALPGGEYSVPIIIQLENRGTRPLAYVQVSDDLTRELAPASPIAISGLRAEGGLTRINVGFDGETVTNLLDGTETLDPGAIARIHFEVRFSTNGQPGPFFNLATAVAKDLDKKQSVSACSRPMSDESRQSSILTANPPASTSPSNHLGSGSQKPRQTRSGSVTDGFARA